MRLLIKSTRETSAMSIISHDDIMKTLNKCYDWAIEGVGLKDSESLISAESAQELAECYLKENGYNKEDAVNSLIRYQNAKVAASGFVNGLGGFVTLPVTVPADLAATLYVQIRMIAAIAHIYGLDVKNDKTRTLIYVLLVGSSIQEITSEIAIKVSLKAAESALKKLPGRVLIEINKKVGFRLLTKFGEKGVINLVKFIPILGGIVGASVNAYFCNSIGDYAHQELKKMSPPETEPENFPPSSSSLVRDNAQQELDKAA